MADLTSIKPGDYLAINNRQSMAEGPYKVTLRLGRVTRLTPTQAVINASTPNEVRIRLKDGRRVGTYYETWFVPTPEQIAEHKEQVSLKDKHRMLLDWFGILATHRNAMKLTIEQLDAMKTAYEAVGKDA